LLLDKIIELATDIQQPLSVLLRQCILLCYELKNESLKTWANQELNGYPDAHKVPEYRVMNAGATGVIWLSVSKCVPRYSSIIDERRAQMGCRVCSSPRTSERI